MKKFNKLYNEYIEKPVLTFENKELLLVINREDFLQILRYGKDLEIVLDKIKEEVEYWGYEEEYNDDRIFCKCMKKIHELLEEIENE